MSKVLIDREDFAHELWAAAQLAPGEGISDGVARLAALLAQPAEAEGVVPEPYGWIAVGELYMLRENAIRAAGKSSCIGVYTRPQLLAALSAVTAERDQLRAEVEALRAALFGIASVNPAERGIEWAKSYASDGLKGAGSELYARWLDTFKEAEALRKRARTAEREAAQALRTLKGLEKVARVVDANSDEVCGENNRMRSELEALRKDAERYRMFRRGMFDPDRFDADIDAAMAAKEA